MKKTLYASWLLGAAMLTSPAIAEQKETVRFGVEGAYPPFSYTQQDGTLAGFDIDLAHALCQEMAVKCKLVAQDWDGIIPGLLARKYDAIIAAMAITDERKRVIDFTDKYSRVPNRFVMPADSAFEIKAENLKDKKIGVQRATTHDKYLTDNYGEDLRIIRYGSTDEAYLDLRSGRVDAVFSDVLAIQEGFMKRAGGEDFVMQGPLVTDSRWFGEGSGIAVRKQDTRLKERLNQAILALRQNGEYQKINARYFDFDIYGE
ncbi:ABC transporter substrate-binding protein [Oceanimonas marisflavi]|uniref:ABC transporter substrate-binding protein n=1 Tax=Oceanimonas marisflavi TaxID=2059724 RepID=UPI000D30F5C5|nr:ABC transporter substrate-binding protein [Oceanimonas marisflavi]